MPVEGFCAPHDGSSCVRLRILTLVQYLLKCVGIAGPAEGPRRLAPGCGECTAVAWTEHGVVHERQCGSLAPEVVPMALGGDVRRYRCESRSEKVDGDNSVARAFPPHILGERKARSDRVVKPPPDAAHDMGVKLRAPNQHSSLVERLRTHLTCHASVVSAPSGSQPRCACPSPAVHVELGPGCGVAGPRNEEPRHPRGRRWPTA